MWFLKAAQEENPVGELNLAMMYETGLGVEQDYEMAAAWYRQSAMKGEAQAQYNLGMLYDNGYGVELNATEAVSWYRKAAEQGMPDAQYNLAISYQEQGNRTIKLSRIEPAHDNQDFEKP